MFRKPCSLFLILFLLVAGCAKDPSPSDGTDQSGNADFQEQQTKQQPEPATDKLTHVVTVETVYYKGGPMQGRAPEGNFSAGTKVELMPEEKIGSYVLVKSESGIEAYVSADALNPIEK